MRQKLPPLNHAPLPYKVSGASIHSKDGSLITELEQTEVLNGGNNFDTAIFMVVACNAHDTAVEGLQDALAQIEYLYSWLPEAQQKFTKKSMTECRDKLSAALDKCEKLAGYKTLSDRR